SSKRDWSSDVCSSDLSGDPRAASKPWGKHPLSNALAGLNTASTLRGDHRIVFRSTISPEGTGLIEVVAIGPRSNNRVYDAVNARSEERRVGREARSLR